MPAIDAFGPYMDDITDDYINMTVEEYETIRHIDHEGFTQAECAEFMEIGRSTVQRLYEIARQKIADSIVNGKVLKIEGGHYRLCNQLEEDERCGRCYRNRRRFRGGRGRN